jgi:hypothetical protein
MVAMAAKDWYATPPSPVLVRIAGENPRTGAGTRRRQWSLAPPRHGTAANPSGAGMSPIAKTVVLLMCSNVFMTFAWYAHLKELNGKPWLIAAAASWGIALFEYLLQVPANRIGYQTLTVGQLKILQEVIALSVFAPFSVLYLKEPLKLDYLWATLCMIGAVFFIFRSKLAGA